MTTLEAEMWQMEPSRCSMLLGYSGWIGLASRDCEDEVSSDEHNDGSS